ncbi:MAG: histidine kinase [Chitinophagaceae bacterium]
MKRPWYNSKWLNIALHGTFWILFFLVPWLLQPSFQDGPGGRRSPWVQPSYFYFNLVKCFFWMCLFYLNAYFLVPRLIYRKKYLLYLLSVVLLLLVLSALEFTYFNVWNHRARFRINSFLLFNLSPFLFIMAVGAVYRLFVDKTIEERTRQAMQAENLKSELSFLRSQISPHFMFNVINNIVALARKKSDLVEPSLIKLSLIMRYFLYESNAEKVSLEKEIEYLQSYIDLQQQRFGQNVAISLSSNSVDGNYEIEPMLLIPFVENAFKHGVIQNGAINIALDAKMGVLHFSVANLYSEENTEAKDEISGIGLANVKRRLNLLYNKRHSLVIDKKNGWFTVSLELKLN